jgi:CubicO group peptidase (beta-lactamase class C family)
MSKKYLNFNSITLLLTITFLFSHSNAIKAQMKNELKDLDAFVDSAMKRWNVPGLAIGIVKDGKIIYTKGYGCRDLKTKEAVTTQTLFSIASSTKSFTATVAALVVDEKKMSFDIPLKTYFPDFQMYDPAASEKVTLRDLLTHRTGIPRQKFFSINTPPARKDVRYSMKYFEPNIDFRYSWQYCNETYTVAGDMVAERAGSTWENLIKKRILEPIGMNNTFFSFRDLKDKTDYAKPYIDWTGTNEEMDYHDADILGPAGCIITNIEDLSKWVLFNLNKGKVNDTQIINPQRLRQIQSPQMVVPGISQNKEISFQNYGMGWFIDYYRGVLRIHHEGNLYGFSSVVSFLPNDNVGIVILVNTMGTPFTDILERYVYERLLKMEPIDWHKKEIEIDEAQKKQLAGTAEAEKKNDSVQKPPLPLVKYTGTFTSDGYGSLKVRLENDSLKVKLLKFDCPFIYQKENSFELYHPVEHSGWKTEFIKDDKGNIISLAIQIMPNVKPIVFKKKE